MLINKYSPEREVNFVRWRPIGEEIDCLHLEFGSWVNLLFRFKREGEGGSRENNLTSLCGKNVFIDAITEALINKCIINTDY